MECLLGTTWGTPLPWSLVQCFRQIIPGSPPLAQLKFNEIQAELASFIILAKFPA